MTVQLASSDLDRAREAVAENARRLWDSCMLAQTFNDLADDSSEQCARAAAWEFNAKLELCLLGYFAALKAA